MSKYVILIIIIAIIAFVVISVKMCKGPDMSEFDDLLTPKISDQPTQKMLVVETKGDPAKTSGEAIKILYKAFYSLEGVPKGKKMAAPRARWPRGLDTPKDEWLGIFALPIPDEVQAIPEVKNPKQYHLYIIEWEYGFVGEILHKGPYDKEEESIKKLTDYIAREGYQIIGDHEEEYLRGPGMFGKGNPENYLTLIRYRLTKKEEGFNENY